MLDVQLAPSRIKLPRPPSRLPPQNRNPEWPPFPLKRLRAGLRRGAYNSAVDLSIQLTRSVLDWEAAVRLPEHLGRRLRKGARRSRPQGGALHQ
jgi:hypothetical protein